MNIKQVVSILKGFVIFAVCGMAVEVFFNSFKTLYDTYSFGNKLDFSLAGKTYIWMFFIYGAGFILVDTTFPILKKLMPTLVLRLPIYVLGIFLIEYFTGWGLATVIGKCPWEYHSPYSLSGYINLGYTPFWAMFAIGLEQLYMWTKRVIVL